MHVKLTQHLYRFVNGNLQWLGKEYLTQASGVCLVFVVTLKETNQNYFIKKRGRTVWKFTY